MGEDSQVSKPIGHRGKKVRVKWLGGESHGQEGMLPRPIKKEVVTAAPPLYLGNNFYEPDPAKMKYDRYTLQSHGAELYYVHDDWLNGFPGNINDPYETTNQRLIREEKERGGPIDLVEGEEVPEDIKRFMNQNVVGRCSKCLRVTFKESDLGQKCAVLKPDNRVCDGIFKEVAKAPDSHGRKLDKNEEAKAIADFEQHGIAFIVNGKRVDPHEVKMMVNKKKPLAVKIKDLLSG